MKQLEHTLESLIFKSRWLLAPFFVGLIIAIIVLIIKFTKELISLVSSLFIASEINAIVSILTLVDTTLIACLLLIIVFSGYENFVSKLDIGDHKDRPGWMGKIGFADLKIKLIGAIVAISAVEMLKAFIDAGQLTGEQLGWKLALHLGFVISGVLFALTDRISEGGKGK